LISSTYPITSISARVLFSSYSDLKQKTEGTSATLRGEVEMLCWRPGTSVLWAGACASTDGQRGNHNAFSFPRRCSSATKCCV